MSYRYSYTRRYTGNSLNRNQLLSLKFGSVTLKQRYYTKGKKYNTFPPLYIIYAKDCIWYLLSNYWFLLTHRKSCQWETSDINKISVNQTTFTLLVSCTE